jgi:hypothetical protein
MIKKYAALFLSGLSVIWITGVRSQSLDPRLKKLSDSPTDSIRPLTSDPGQVPYEKAIQNWKTISDVNNWIKANFRYEMERAKQLANNSSERENISILTPSEFYERKTGICVDLSRFAVETINHMDPSKRMQYLMIDFEPIVIDGKVLTKHWMAVYQDTSGYYTLADSKRPGYIAGPYKNMSAFITEYETFRNRKIITWQVLAGYGKNKKTMQKKMIHSLRGM